MQINNNKSLYNPNFKANILISGEKELLKQKQIVELSEMIKSFGNNNDIIEFNIGSKIIDTVEINKQNQPQRFLSGYKLFVKSTVKGINDIDLSTAKTQQDFFENYDELSPFSVIKSWIKTVKENTLFNKNVINLNPNLYNASNNNWYNNATFVVPCKKHIKKGYKIDIYKFQELLYSKIYSERKYNELIIKAKEDKEKLIAPNDIIAFTIQKNSLQEEPFRKLIRDAEEYNNHHCITTQRLYSDLKGNYDRERTKIHNKILNGIFINSNDAKPISGNKPSFIMLGGRGGSGKTKFGKEGIANVYNKNSYIVLNSDEIKKMLPEYNGFNSGELHEESFDIINKALVKAKQEGLNVVLDCTMSNFEYCENILKDFNALGYDIELYFMYLPREKAAERAILRFNYNKRYIPLDILLKMTDNEINFDKLKKYAQKYGFYSNDVKLDTNPILIDFGVPNLFQWIYKKCEFVNTHKYSGKKV